MSTAGGVQYTGGYHDECGGISVHWGFHTNSIVFPMTFPTLIIISPSVLMISPSVLNTPQCTHDIPWCNEHPPLYCTHFGVLHRHYMQGASQFLAVPSRTEDKTRLKSW